MAASIPEELDEAQDLDDDISDANELPDATDSVDHDRASSSTSGFVAGKSSTTDKVQPAESQRYLT